MPPKGQRATSVPMFMLYTIDELVDRSGGYYSAGTLKDYRRKPGMPMGQRFRAYWTNLLGDDPRLQGRDLFGEDEEGYGVIPMPTIFAIQRRKPYDNHGGS